jgi:hypothetical protein
MPHQQNSFLAALSASDLDLLRPLLTKITLWPGDQLQQFDRPVEHVIFPHSGLVALTLRNGNSPGPVLIGKGVATDWNWNPIAVLAKKSTARISHLLRTSGPPNHFCGNNSAAVLLDVYRCFPLLSSMRIWLKSPPP